jgi:hypothetical protein
MYKKVPMRYIFFIFLNFSSLFVAGQKIEFRNDSLFVNDFHVDASTGKLAFDSLLRKAGKKKISKDKENLATGKKVKQTTYYYHDLGLFFRKYTYDTTKLSIGIKLYPYYINKEEANNGIPGRPFSGQLFIAENLINNKRQVSELQKMKNCTVTVSEMSYGSNKTIISGELIYQQKIIRLAFDRQTKELAEVFIHHNSKE